MIEINKIQLFINMNCIIARDCFVGKYGRACMDFRSRNGLIFFTIF